MSDYNVTDLVPVNPNIAEISKKVDEIGRHVESNLDRVRKRVAELLAVRESEKQDGRFKGFEQDQVDKEIHVVDNNLEHLRYRMTELRTFDEKEQDEIVKKMNEVEKDIDANLATTRRRMKELLNGGTRKKQVRKKESGRPVGRGTDNHGFDREDRIEASHRAKLMQGTQSLNRASESIARTQHVAAETDQIGVDIIDELGQQREQLSRTREKLVDTDQNLSKSRKILKSMAIRVMTNKMILIVIILIELGLLGGLTYWKFFS